MLVRFMNSHQTDTTYKLPGNSVVPEVNPNSSTAFSSSLFPSETKTINLF